MKTASLHFPTEILNTGKVGRSFLGIRNHRRRMGLLMMFADLLGFALAMISLLILNSFAHFFTPGVGDLKYLIVLLLCFGFFATSRLHPGVGISPADEIRLVTQSISLSLLISLAIFTVFDIGWVANALVFMFAWLGSILSVLVCRWVVKIIGARAGLWGEPVFVVGRDAGMNNIVDFFLRRRRLGYIPIGAALKTGSMNSIPSTSMGTFEKLPNDYFRNSGIQTVIVSDLLFSNLKPSVAKKLHELFTHIIFIANTQVFEGTSMLAHDFEGLIGIESRKNSLSPLALVLKRMTDIAFSVVLSLVVLPISVFIATFIRLEGSGPILYSQERLGLHGKRIRILKFRTMVHKGDQVLEHYLATNKVAASEWAKTQKLENDPRVTKVGRVLRKWSLDELPQIVNVLRGEMSLVGPRPIMADQASLYGDRIDAYFGMRPGMSGLWQVSGRNKRTFEERANFDVYYVRNWSLWLDIYILLRTLWVVARGNGAY